MTVKELRSLTGLTQTEFAEKYKIPMRSIQNWEGGQRTPPEYVIELLEFRIKHDYEAKQ